MKPGPKYSDYITPTLARLSDEPFNDPDWIFELKWDGYRAIAELNGSSVKFYSRNGLSFSSKYPLIVSALKNLSLNAILDGEVVVLDEHGKPDFQKLQLYGQKNYPICYYVFDCLEYNHENLMHKPLIERKNILKSFLPVGNVIRYSDHVDGEGVTFFQSIQENNIEGMIAKKKSSIYMPGKRTDLWLKIKHHNILETVICGFTEPRGSRPYFGALILGIHNTHGALEYVGHTGTGFTESLLKEVHSQLIPLVKKHSPFREKVKVNAPVTWVEPKLVCSIKYTEVTAEGILRHPVFMGLRPDKNASEVVVGSLGDFKKIS